MQRSWILILSIVSVLAIPSIGAQEQTVLEPTGLKAGAPEEVLPGGAILHFRLNNFETTLNTLNDIVMTVLPEKALPPQLAPMLAQPRPVIAFLTAQAFGAPMEAKVVGKMFGFAVEQPISLTFYPGPPNKNFVLSIPVADFKAVTGFAANILKPRLFKKLDSNGKTIFQIDSMNPSLPNSLFVRCSADRAYFAGSADLAAQLAPEPPAWLMKDDALFGIDMKTKTGPDLAATAKVDFLKQMLPQFQGFGKLPQPKIEQLRQKILTSIPPKQLLKINMRLRMQFGIRDIHELLDYCECFVTAAYEILFQEVFNLVSGFDGVRAELDLAKDIQRVNLSIFSNAFKAQTSTQPLQIQTIVKALGQMPNRVDALTVSGRQALQKRSATFKRWMTLAHEKMKAKELPEEGFTAFTKFWNEQQSVPSLHSKVDWSLKTFFSTMDGLADIKADTVEEFISKVTEHATSNALMGSLTVLPNQAKGFLENHFAEEAKIKTANTERNRAYLAAKDSEPFFSQQYRFLPSAAKDGIHKLIFEDAILTKSGFFGYSQHELINRRVTWYLPAGEYLFLQNGTNKNWIDNLSKRQNGNPTKTSTMSPALAKLFTFAPKNPNSISAFSGLHRLVDLIKTLSHAEEAARTEIDTYLAQAKKDIAAGPKGVERFEKLPLPFFVQLVTQNTRTKEISVRLPGNLVYPRPAVMTKVLALLQPFADKANDIGGGGVFTAASDGKYTITAVQSTEALGFLIKSVGNTFMEKYGQNGSPPKNVIKAISTPDDGQPTRDAVLLYNDFWDFLNEL